MLTLSRKVGERIMIGADITIMVVDIKDNGSRVKIGIDAPRDIPVHREEVFHEIARDALHLPKK